MRPLHAIFRPRIAGITLPDLLAGAAVSGVLAAGMLTTISALRKSSLASHHHAQSQLQKSRIIDYISRDLRRALTVQVDTYKGAERLRMTLPDYYDPAGGPREPVIDGGNVRYGAPGSGVAVSYYKDGDKVYRSVNGTAAVLASDLNSFKIDYTDSGKQAVTVSISFVPRYANNPSDTEGMRQNNTAVATTLLRNKRQ